MSQLDQEVEPDEKVIEEEAPPKRSKKNIALLTALFAGVIVIVLLVSYLVRANADDGPDPVAVTVPVGLSEVALPNNSKLGVVVTLGSGTTEGSQWQQAAQGAVVAQQRLEVGGLELALISEDDGGSATGSAEAVQELIDQGVAGIIYASSGEHVDDGLAVAQEAEVPVILPYTPAPQDASNVWSLTPTADQTAATLATEIAKFERPLHINAGDDLPQNIEVSDEVTFTSETDTDDFSEDIALRTGADPYANGAYTGGGEDDQAPAPVIDNPADVVVVSGAPVLQAHAVFALQSGNVSVPIVLTEHAVSPRFDQTLIELGGTVSSNLRTVGATWDDGTALGTTGQSRAMSAFLSATRQFASDESLTNLTDDAPFAEAAAVADVRGHDAVLAFSEALDRAGNTDPVKVAEELSALELAAGNGIAGPALDFSQPHALTEEPTVLHASSQRLGLRPTNGESTDVLVWIPQPSDEQ